MGAQEKGLKMAKYWPLMAQAVEIQDIFTKFRK